MLRPFAKCVGLALALAVALTGAASFAAEGPAASKEYPVEKAKKALNQVVTMTFEQQTLPQVVEELRKSTKINFAIDDAIVFQGNATDPESLHITGKLEQVKLGRGLKSLLAPHHMTFVVLAEQVLITSTEAAVNRQMRQPINLDLKEVPVKDALHQLQRELGVNLLVDARTGKAETKITVTLDQVPLETAVRLMTEMADLTAVRLDNVLFVTGEATAKRLRAEIKEQMQALWAPLGPGMGLGGGIGGIPGVGALGALGVGGALGALGGPGVGFAGVGGVGGGLGIVGGAVPPPPPP